LNRFELVLRDGFRNVDPLEVGEDDGNGLLSRLGGDGTPRLL
jgi:hypothetical protein